MLTYIEPCGWCSSSISSLKCPSKSIESCQSLSSSLSLSQNSLKSYQKTAFSTSIIRSTYSHPHDYHSRKRIDELHERLDEIQIRNFLQFINFHLHLNKSNVNLQIDDFLVDLSNGQIFLDLIEKFSSTKLPRERGRTRFHSLINIQHILNYFKSHQQYIDISPNEIVSGNRKSILALLWTIMKYFDFPNFRLINRNCFQEKTLLSSGQDRSVLLNWLNNLLNQCLIDQQTLVKDFYIQTWMNGYYLSLILKYLLPISENYSTMKSFDYLKQLNTNSCDRCFEICLQFSNYCFHTSMNVNYDDKSEISLLKYFSDLHTNIFQLIQSDHLGKLVQINPYTKQILQTIEQEHSSNVINVNEQYLVCIQENRNSDSIEQRDKEEEIVDVNESVEDIEHVTINLPLVEEFHQLQSDEQTISINDDDDKQTIEITEAESLQQSSVDTPIEAVCDKDDINNEIENTSSDRLKEQIVPCVEPETTSEMIEQNVHNQSEILAKLPDVKLELSVVKEIHQPSVSNNACKNPSTYRNKKFYQSPKKFIPNNAGHSQSTVVVDKNPVETAAVTPVRCSKYRDVVNQSVPSIKREQPPPKKKIIPSEPVKQSIIITEEIRTVPIQQPEPVQLTSIQQEQPKKSSKKHKKSKRSNAKQSTPLIIDEQPTIVDEPEPTTTTTNNENSNIVRSRRSRRKKTVATKNTTIIEKTPSPNRNLFVIIQECLRERKLIAFKCVIILVCLCFSIISLVLSHN